MLDDPSQAAPVRISPLLRVVADRARGFLALEEAEALYDAAWAMAPYGVLFVTLPSGEVGEYCPFVRP